MFLLSCAFGCCQYLRGFLRLPFSFASFFPRCRIPTTPVPLTPFPRLLFSTVPFVTLVFLVRRNLYLQLVLSRNFSGGRFPSSFCTASRQLHHLLYLSVPIRRGNPFSTCEAFFVTLSSGERWPHHHNFVAEMNTLYSSHHIFLSFYICAGVLDLTFI